MKQKNDSLITQKRESALIERGYRWIAGVDEAGRGPLAGPVVAAAYIVPIGCCLTGVDDSKKLSRAQRSALFDKLIHHKDAHYGVGVVDVETIDRINILQATILAMQEAIQKLDLIPDYLLVDGLKLPYPGIPSDKVIKGDAEVYSIAAASIIAKETRDRLMEDYDRQWPEYQFAKHKGYGTAQHLKQIKSCGPCPIHRKTFEPIKSICNSLMGL